MWKLILVFLLLPFSLHARLQGQARLDSLLHEASLYKKQDTFQVLLLKEISFEYSRIKPEEGLKYGAEALKLAERLSWEKGQISACNSLLVNYWAKADHPAALEYGNKGLELAERSGDKKHVSSFLNNIALIYTEQGNFAKSLELQLKAIGIEEELHDSNAVAGSNLNIATVYVHMGDYARALRYYETALNTFEKTGDKRGVEMCLGNMGSVYNMQSNFAKSLEYFNRTLKICEELGDKGSIMLSYCNIGDAYTQLGNYKKALDYAFNGLKMSEELGDSSVVASALRSIGEIYLKIAQDSSFSSIAADSRIPAGRKPKLLLATEYFEKSIAIYKRVNEYTILNEAYLKLTDAYSLLGDYKAALQSHRAYSAARDSVFSTDNRVKMANMGMQREVELKQRQIEINKIQDATKKRERTLYIVGICMMGVIIILVSRNYTRQRRTSARLKAANAQLAGEKTRSDELAANLKESLMEKEELTNQLTVSAAMKSRFLANISHELRTPVTLLTGMLELMKEDTEARGLKSEVWGAESGVRGVKSEVRGAESGERLEVAYNNSRKLQYMVEEILDLSRLEQNEPRLDAESKEITPLLRRMVYAFETFIAKVHLALEFKEESTGGVCVAVDENKLEKIVNNLVYNAVKFNQKGGWIKVSACLSEDRHQFIFAVSNSGNGISATDLPHVFERFYQGDTSKAKAEGMGIGLSLVKEFTELMGGKVRVASTEGDSTTFTLLLPVAEKPALTNEADPEVLLPPVEVWEHFPERQVVLLVEDNADMRYYLREILSEKVNLAEATNGKEALAWLENNRADLVISDIMMPEMDGREFITILKNSEKYKKMPVITLTALADMESQLDMLRMGIDDYIVKPFNARELRIRVYNLLHNLEERKQFANQPTEPDDMPAGSPEADGFREKVKSFVLARMKTIDVSVYDLAYELGMSERQLYRNAKSLTGCTPAQMIKEVRLQKAYELLLAGGITKIEYLARLVGFEDPGYFSKQFFERFGKRPTEFLS